jgi:hypothetical protein
MEKSKLQKAVERREARLMRAYRELERLDGEHGGRVIMAYDVAEPRKVDLLLQLAACSEQEKEGV